MLYTLLFPLKDQIGLFNIFRYITVRTALAAATALLICLFLGPLLIRYLKKKQIGEEIRAEGPQSHFEKKGTPSMGGILIIFAAVIPTLLWADMRNSYVRIALFAMISFGLVGFLDDYLKIILKKPKGLTIHRKFTYQFVLSLIIGLFLIWLGHQNEFNLHLIVPFFKNWTPYLGWFYLPWIMFILVSSSNAVNLADGLDGLATGLTLISVTAFTALSFIAGRTDWSSYLDIAWVPQAAELTIFVGALAGACLGFLWFNCHPAQLFMGDVGALSLGGTIGTIAILIKMEFLLFMVAGVFVIEALSVLLQVGYFKLSGGRRIFKMAPLHHHFELKGWPEEKVVVRFWITGIIFALFSLATLKLR
ncbi:MAG: phospho-N-acetylmuramoyl-pentapeptide-transferase [Acidobacteria bacterium]|nr:phospho-N-acetylmuramoyl-pentapeptide-transferase [Acidobacteriota bacterium]MBU1473478.1 phospho-N-acetylmuramoyl-pentapeptide-transferase [Acidobacteriota bacterium]MBU2438495.1 phospho-N-acetylmuramoyl-pentapeptide-transferase [Acidobacteriota bacterium]